MHDPIHPIGLLIAVISAAAFTIGFGYAIRSRGIDLDTPLKSLFTGDGWLIERELFSTVLLERRSPGFGIFLSIALHVCVVLGTPVLPYLFPDRLDINLRRFEVRMMEVRIPGPLLYAAQAQEQEGKARRRPAVPPKRRAVKRTPATQPVRQVAAAKPKLQLPWRAKGPARDIVIQPDQPPELTMALKRQIPSAFLWAQGPSPAEISRLVGTPPRPRLPEFRLPSATPSVQKPNLERAISDLQIASAPVLTFRPPQLPVHAANVSPVRMPAPPLEAPGELPPSELPQGTPLNLIALMTTPAPPTPAYLLEAGNRLPDGQPGGEAPAAPKTSEMQPGASQTAGRSERATPGGTSPAGAAAAPRASETAAPDTSTTAPAPAGPPNAPGQPDAAPAPASPPKGSHADLLAAGTAEREGSASGSPRLPSAASGPAPAIAPAGGNLGVIVVHQTSRETIDGAEQVLTGQPVYTVYFDVPGSPRRWILQYCVPGSEARSFVREGDGVIRILPRRTVQPPYPLDRIPVDIRGYEQEKGRLVVYAFVNERGETENVRLVRGTGREIDTTAVATLRKWTFRPARRGETPVAVEALFGIPLN